MNFHFYQEGNKFVPSGFDGQQASDLLAKLDMSEFDFILGQGVGNLTDKYVQLWTLLREMLDLLSSQTATVEEVHAKGQAFEIAWREAFDRKIVPYAHIVAQHSAMLLASVRRCGATLTLSSFDCQSSEALNRAERSTTNNGTSRSISVGLQLLQHTGMSQLTEQPHTHSLT